MKTLRVLSAAALISLVMSVPTTAAPPKVESFEIATWEQLQKQSPRPTAVVFTATYCANCPAVISKLSEALQRKGVKSEIVAVVIDEAEEKALLESEHYKHASRLFLFEGNEAALRYKVDPRWRGVTPYTALLGADGKMTFAAGMPSDEQIGTWLSR